MNETMIQTVRIAGADGVEHEYMIVPMTVERGVPIMLRLYAAAAGPLGELLKGLLGALWDALSDDGESSGGLQAMLDSPAAAQALGDAIRDMDLGAVGRDLQAALLDPRVNASGLFSDLLTDVRRDGKRLGDGIEMDVAYRGNYVEMLRAAWEVIRVNRFLPAFGGTAGGDQTDVVSSPPTNGKPG